MDQTSSLSSEALDVLRQHIGNQAHASDVVTPRLVDQFRATLAPHLALLPDDVPPPAIHWCLAPGTPDTLALGDDGHPPKGGFLPLVPFPRRMWAGGEIELFDPLRLGDHVERISTVADVYAKEGKTGALVFVIVAHEHVTERGVAIRERQNIVYRPMPKDAGTITAPAPVLSQAPKPDTKWSVAATPPLLFRYSALTFNSHRIHYDLPYATKVEGYAGLVVHGPLQASLLLNLATSVAGKPPRHFKYVGMAPLIAGGPFDVCTKHKAGDVLECWTGDRHGQVNMKATATFA